MSVLREYQAEAVDALRAGWRKGGRRLGVALPTGVGKTHIMAHLAREEAAAPGTDRVMVLVHRDVLVDQTVARVRATVLPGTSVGVLKAERNELGARVIVASVHSLRSATRREQLPPIGLCIVDEAHVSVSPTYTAVFGQIGALDGTGARMAGFTATWSRSDSVGLGDVWQDVVYRRSIRWAIRHGHLVQPRALRVGSGVDMSDARVSRATGDWREDDAERVVMLDSIRDVVVRGALEHGRERPSVLFAPTVASAEFLADGLREAGLTTAGIYHSTPPTVRRRLLAEHRDGSLDVLTTCTALAVGWDAPHCSRGLLCRPTRHEGLFVQLVGRLLRPWPGKADALLLDFVGTTADVGLAAAVELETTDQRRAGVVDDEEDDEPTDDPDEPAGPPSHAVRLARETADVDLFAGTTVQWLTGPSGVPFVPCGDKIVMVVQGRDGGWCVGVCSSTTNRGGRWVAEGLAQDDALTVASDVAEELGEHLSRRSAAWRSGHPSDKQVILAGQLGYRPAEGERLTRGQVSDEISVRLAERALAPIAAWSRAIRTEARSA